MKLFTEFEKMQRRPSNDVTDLAPFCVFFPFNMGKCPPKIKKFKLGGKKSQHWGVPKPPFWFWSEILWFLTASQSRILKISFFRDFSGTYVANFSLNSQKTAKFERKMVKFFRKNEIFKIRPWEAVRNHKIWLQNQNGGFGTPQCWDFFPPSWFSSHFLAIFPYK